MQYFVGIDHGTTYTAVSAVKVGEDIPRIVELGRDSLQQTPTVVHSDGASPPAVQTGTVADNLTATEPDRVLKWYKPLLESDGGFTFQGLTLIDATAEMLRGVLADAAARLNEPITRAMITVPAWFHDPARQATLEAAKRAGLTDVTLENEPTTAAYFYHKRAPLDPGDVLAVYDLGGGTFDVSIVEFTPQKTLNVLASKGDMELGGHHWTNALIEHVAGMYRADTGIDLTAIPAEKYELYNQCEKAKRQLSQLPRAKLNVGQEGGEARRYVVTRDEFEKLTKPQLEPTGKVMSQAIADAGRDWGRAKHVLLVGGSTRMVQVEQFVKVVAGRAAELLDDRDQMVAHGAALLLKDSSPRAAAAGIGMVINRTVPHALATWVKAGRGLRCEVIVPANAKVSDKGSRRFSRQHDNATEIDIPVFQGGIDGQAVDPTNVQELFLKKHRFSGIPPVPKLDKEIEVTFTYNTSQIIEVTEVFRPETSEEKTLPSRVEDWAIDESLNSRGEDVQLVVALDCSGSMSGQSLDDAKSELTEIAKRHLGDGSGFRLSVVAFPHQIFGAAGVVVREATNAGDVAKRVAPLFAGGSTPMTDALEEIEDLLGGISPETDRHVFLISDGAPDDEHSARSAGLSLKASGAKLYAIPIGTDPSGRKYLEGFCDKVLPIQTTSGLSQAFRDLLSE